nr:MAG TPA: hypothetical protein [Bacteriophage sp.]
MACARHKDSSELWLALYSISELGISRNQLCSNTLSKVNLTI